MGKKGKGELSAGKAAAKAAKRAKQEKLADRKATKAEKKAKGQTAAVLPSKSGKGSKAKAVDDDEQDLDAILADFKAKWEAQHQSHEESVAEAPSRRANATLTPCPLGTDLWLFGGEYFDGEKAAFYPDLYRYTPSSNVTAALNSASSSGQPTDPGTWRLYTSGVQPGPRSAHQVAASPASGGQLWLFGGEFASSRMTSFHHYRDLWVFSIATKQWDRIDTKVRPSARSGHRMVCWKNFLVLFGGFQDTGQRTTYLGDLWLFDLTEYKWHEVKQDDLRKPPARSGFSFLPCAEGIALYGGYCKRYVKGQKTQGVALEDAWLLKLEPGADGDLLHSGKIEWQRRRKVGYAPGQRSGCTMALWGPRNMGVLFGGVTDSEADEESMESTCHDTMYGYQLGGTGRWISLNLRKPKKKAGEARRLKKMAEQQQREQERKEAGDGSGSDSSDGEGDDDDERVEDGEGNKSEGGEGEAAEEGSANARLQAAKQLPEKDPEDPQSSVPLGRYNTMLAVQRNILYIYGGIHETSTREYTLDDFFILDLNKMDRFSCLKACPVEGLEWRESDDESDSDSSDGESDDGDAQQGGAQEEEEQEQEGVEWDAALDLEDLDEKEAEKLIAKAKREKEEAEELRKKAQAFMGVSKDSTRSEEEILSTPLPGETLKAFYERSKSYWANKAYAQSEGQSRGKEMRRDGFGLAEKQYSEYEPMLREIERIQREAGLDAEDLKNARPGLHGGGAGVDSRNRR